MPTRRNSFIEDLRKALKDEMILGQLVNAVGRIMELEEKEEEQDGEYTATQIECR